MLISGATVMIAMAGMLFTGDKTFDLLSIATMIVVAVAMIGSLTVLPALLSKLGDRVEKGRIPLLARLRRPAGESRVWAQDPDPGAAPPGRLGARRRGAAARAGDPGAAPAHRTSRDATRCRAAPPTVETLDRVQAAFPGQASPAVVAVQSTRHDPAVEQAIGALTAEGRSAAAGSATARSASTRTPPHTVARISIPLPGNGVDAPRPRRC